MSGARRILSTFSIAAYDPEVRAWGVAVQSRFLASGWIVPWARAEVGAVATQARANPTFGPRGLELMARGRSATDALEELLSEDSSIEGRQVGLVDRSGEAAAFTGPACNTWAGHRVGEGSTCQGNILAGPGVVEEMHRYHGTSRGQLADRLVEALRAGQEAGGDRRGQQSAAVLVVQEGEGYGGFDDRYVDLRVDDATEPIEELHRILQRFKITFHKTTRFDVVPWGPEREQAAVDILSRSGSVGAGDIPRSRRELQGVLFEVSRRRGIADPELDSGIDGRLWRLLGEMR